MDSTLDDSRLLQKTIREDHLGRRQAQRVEERLVLGRLATRMRLSDDRAQLDELRVVWSACKDKPCAEVLGLRQRVRDQEITSVGYR